MLEALDRRLRRSLRVLALAGVVGFATALLVASAASAAPSSALPNPRTLLTAAHAQKELDPGRSVTVGATHLTSNADSVGCSEAVGAVTVYVSLYAQDYGFGGVINPIVTHPSGLGGGIVIVIVGKSVTGGAVVIARFRKGTVYAIVSASGGAARGLTVLSQQIYKLLR